MAPPLSYRLIRCYHWVEQPTHITARRLRVEQVSPSPHLELAWLTVGSEQPPSGGTRKVSQLISGPSQAMVPKSGTATFLRDQPFGPDLLINIASLFDRAGIAHVLWGNSLLDIYGVPTGDIVSTVPSTRPAEA